MNVNLLYLADRDMGADAQTLITNEVFARLADMNAAVSFERIPATLTYNNLFRRNVATLTGPPRTRSIERASYCSNNQS